jgi:hypothetical protein
MDVQQIYEKINMDSFKEKLVNSMNIDQIITEENLDSKSSSFLKQFQRNVLTYDQQLKQEGDTEEEIKKKKELEKDLDALEDKILKKMIKDDAKDSENGILGLEQIIKQVKTLRKYSTSNVVKIDSLKDTYNELHNTFNKLDKEKYNKIKDLKLPESFLSKFKKNENTEKKNEIIEKKNEIIEKKNETEEIENKTNESSFEESNTTQETKESETKPIENVNKEEKVETTNKPRVLRFDMLYKNIEKRQTVTESQFNDLQKNQNSEEPSPRAPKKMKTRNKAITDDEINDLDVYEKKNEKKNLLGKN